MQPKANNLFHFTRSIENLKSILSTSFSPRYSLEDCSPLGAAHIAYPMVCFCDIPISRISEHTAFYGQYGIGMTKEWGLKNGLAPLLYSTSDGKLANFVEFVFREVTKEGDEQKLPKALAKSLRRHYYDLIPMMKPITGTMLIGGKSIEKDFSQENEWRYVPEHNEILTQANYESRSVELNKEMESKRLQFTPSDIRYIFVKSDFEIPTVFDLIQSSLSQYPLADIKILISRITSLETLEKDL